MFSKGEARQPIRGRATATSGPAPASSSSREGDRRAESGLLGEGRRPSAGSADADAVADSDLLGTPIATSTSRHLLGATAFSFLDDPVRPRNAAASGRGDSRANQGPARNNSKTFENELLT